MEQACEKALLAYHSMKMEEINASIKELWRNIYKGHDIEYIEIKAEEVTGHASRSHNYRQIFLIASKENPIADFQCLWMGQSSKCEVVAVRVKKFLQVL